MRAPVAPVPLLDAEIDDAPRECRPLERIHQLNARMTSGHAALAAATIAMAMADIDRGGAVGNRSDCALARRWLRTTGMRWADYLGATEEHLRRIAEW